MPDTLNKKIIITGFALLLFSIIIAIIDRATIAYILGGFGLFFVIAGCFIKDEISKKPEETRTVGLSESTDSHNKE